MRIVKLTFLLWLLAAAGVLAQETKPETETEPVWYSLEEAQHWLKKQEKKY